MDTEQQYVYQLVESLIDNLHPDKVERRMPLADSVFHISQKQFPISWQLYFNNLRVTIQTGEYNYCDYHVLNPYHIFRFEHPNTRTAEVTVISCEGHWVNIDDSEYADKIWAQASLSTIEDIVMTIAAYTRP